MIEKKCKLCGEKKPHHAKNKCHACYNRTHYWTNSRTRQRKLQRMKEYSHNRRILRGETNTISFGINLRKKLGVI